MALKKFKPTTPGQRFKIISTFEEITTDVPEKSLLAPKKRSGGRNNTGRMTMRYLGGGHKQAYRIIDFKRDKDNIPATVHSIEYDPNQASLIGRIPKCPISAYSASAPVNTKKIDPVTAKAIPAS